MLAAASREFAQRYLRCGRVDQDPEASCDSQLAAALAVLASAAGQQQQVVAIGIANQRVARIARKHLGWDEVRVRRDVEAYHAPRDRQARSGRV